MLALILSGTLYFVKMREGLIYGGVISLNDCFAALAVSIRNGFLDRGDGLVARQHAADREEAGLHDGVDAAAHAGRARDGIAVDHEEAQFLLEDGFLHLPGNVLPDFVGAKGRVHQERGARFGGRQNVDAIEELELVAGDEIRFGDQVCGTNRIRAEAEVGNGDRAGFLRVVNKIALREIAGSFADDLDGVFVGADGAVRAEAVEQGANGARIFGREIGIVGEAGVRYVIDDADREMIFRFRLLQFIEYGFHHCGREFF